MIQVRSGGLFGTRPTQYIRADHVTNLINCTASGGLKPSGLFVVALSVLYICHTLHCVSPEPCSMCILYVRHHQSWSVEPTSCVTNIPPPVVTPQCWLQPLRLAELPETSWVKPMKMHPIHFYWASRKCSGKLLAPVFSRMKTQVSSIQTMEATWAERCVNQTRRTVFCWLWFYIWLCPQNDMFSSNANAC